jgi:hypothetical protein
MTPPLSLEGLPHISSVNSQPITPGRQTVGITGENFRKAGEAIGRVSLKIGRVSTDLPVVSYSANIIQARVPAEVNDTARREMPTVIEGGVIEGQIGVQTPRGTAVATVQLNIPIDESQLNPKISLVFPKEIQPGQRVSILGEKFLSRERGMVTFHFGSRTVEAIIIDWAPIGILAEMPADISGMRRTAGTVEVENYVHRRDDHNATFVPIEETEELYDELYVAVPARSKDRQSGRKIFFDFDLINGWKVADRWTNQVGSDCFAERRPELGSSNPRYEFLAETSGIVLCQAWVVILGPRGLPYR